MLKLSTLLLICIGLISGVYAQDDCLAGLDFDLADTTEVSCQECVTLTTAFPQLYSTSAYTVEEIDYTSTPYPLTSGNVVVGTTDDIWSGLIPMGFSFCFFDNAYSNIVIGSNGVVTFDAGDAGGYCPWSFSASCPSTALPNNAIFCPFHDINPATCGNVRWQVYGEEPCRQFVVSFQNVCLFSCTSLQTSSQLVLYESTNVIEVYIVNKPACPGWNSGNTLIGIQNISGTVGYTPPGRNTGNWSANAEAWRFVPNGDPIGSVTWYENGLEIGTGETLEYCPDSSNTVYAALNYDFCAAPLAGDDCAFYTVNVTSGTWPGEVDWDLISSGGVVVASGGAPFNQQLCLPNDCYTLNMFDSFGDGWNGAVFSITGEDGIIATATITSGSSGTANFCVDDFIPDEEEEPAPIEGFLIDSTYVSVLFDDIDPGLEAAPVLCTYDDVYQFTATNPDGIWGSDCEGCLDENGLFDIAVAEAGTYTVSYTVTGECGPVVDEVEVVVEAPPMLSLTGESQLCDYSAPVFIEPNIAGGSFTADCGDCIDAETGEFDPSGLPAGSYTVEYTAGENCSSTTTFAVEIDETLTANIVTPEVMCESDTQTLTAETAGGLWSADCGNCINENSGVFNGNLSGSGSFEVSYTFDSFCAIATTATVEVEEAVDATIASIPELCETGDSFDLSATDPNGVWTSNCGDCLSAEGEFDPQISLEGEYTVTYTISGICSDSDQATVIVLSQKDATIIIPDELCIDAGIYETYAVDPGGVWDASCGGCIDEDSGQIDLTLAGEGEFTVFYEIDELCGDSDEATVVVVPCSIEVPNIITPNNDGINDYLEFKNLEFFPGSRLEIRNRWGQLVYENDSYNNSNNWRADGVSDGTYIFILFRGDGEVYQGNITIVRD